LPTTDKLGRRHLSVPEMLVGQALTLLYLDPATLQHGGVIKRTDALSHLAAVMGSDALTRAFNPKRKRVDERVAQETVRGKFAEALRRLAGLGFVDLLDADELRLRPGLLRFAEPVRGRGSPAEALERLVARGELVLGDGLPDGEEPEDADEEAALPDEEEADPASLAPSRVSSEALAEFEDVGEHVPRPAPSALPPPGFDDVGEAAPRPEAPPFPAALPAPEAPDLDDLDDFEDFGEPPPPHEPWAPPEEDE